MGRECPALLQSAAGPLPMLTTLSQSTPLRSLFLLALLALRCLRAIQGSPHPTSPLSSAVMGVHCGAQRVQQGALGVRSHRAGLDAS